MGNLRQREIVLNALAFQRGIIAPASRSVIAAATCGLLVFSEYGGPAFKMPAGTAAVFSCSLLHAVRPMTRGRR